MLFANGAYRHLLAGAVRDARPENCLTQEDTFAVMAQCPMPEVGDVRLALVERVVDSQVVLRRATKGRAERTA